MSDETLIPGTVDYESRRADRLEAENDKLHQTLEKMHGFVAEKSDENAALRAQRDRAVEALHLSRADFDALKRLCAEQPALNSNDVQRMATNAEARARRTLSEIDTETEGER